MPPKRKKDVAIDVDDGEKNYFIIFFSIDVSINETLSVLINVLLFFLQYLSALRDETVNCVLLSLFFL